MSVQDSSNGWKSCPKGAIANLVQARKIAIRRDFLKKTMLAGGTLLATGAAVGVIATQAGWLNKPQSSGLACAQVIAFLPDYLDGSLSRSVRAQVEQHLDKCPHCEEKKKQLASKS